MTAIYSQPCSGVLEKIEQKYSEQIGQSWIVCFECDEIDEISFMQGRQMLRYSCRYSQSEERVLMEVIVRLRSRSPPSRFTHTLLEPPPGLQAMVRSPKANDESKPRASASPKPSWNSNTFHSERTMNMNNVKTLPCVTLRTSSLSLCAFSSNDFRNWLKLFTKTFTVILFLSDDGKELLLKCQGSSTLCTCVEQ